MKREEIRETQERIDMCLSVLCCIVPQGVTMKLDDIADICGVHKYTIMNLQRSAVQKLREIGLNKEDYL